MVVMAVLIIVIVAMHTVTVMRQTVTTALMIRAFMSLEVMPANPMLLAGTWRMRYAGMEEKL
jgi:hypothetical protein